MSCAAYTYCGLPWL